MRQLKADDTDLAEVAKHLNSDEWQDFGHLGTDFSAQSLQEFLENDKHIYLLAYVDNKIAGAAHAYALQHPAGPLYLYIDEVDTALSHRRKGVATAMMHTMFKLGREFKVDEVWLGTEDDNLAAKALYEKLSPDEVEYGPIYTYKVKK